MGNSTFCKTPWILTLILHFSHILNTWFKLHCDDKQNQNYRNGVFVQQIINFIVFYVSTTCAWLMESNQATFINNQGNCPIIQDPQVKTAGMKWLVDTHHFMTCICANSFLQDYCIHNPLREVRIHLSLLSVSCAESNRKYNFLRSQPEQSAHPLRVRALKGIHYGNQLCFFWPHLVSDKELSLKLEVR